MKKIILLICIGLAATSCLSNESNDSETIRAQRAYLASLDEFQWSSELMDAARETCEETYMTWDVEKIREQNYSSAELINNGTTLSCNAVYTILLRGNIVGKRTYNARVFVRGRYSFDNMGNLHFTLEETQIMDGPATANELADHAAKFLGKFL